MLLLVNMQRRLESIRLYVSVDYQKNANTTVAVPLYSYRDHGNGRVATFTSSITGGWLNGWSSSAKETLFTNILITNTPTEHVNYPFTINMNYEGDTSSIEIIPSSVNPKALKRLRCGACCIPALTLSLLINTSSFNNNIHINGVWKTGIGNVDLSSDIRSSLIVHRSSPTVKHFYFCPSNRAWCQNEQNSLKIVQKQT